MNSFDAADRDELPVPASHKLRAATSRTLVGVLSGRFGVERAERLVADAIDRAGREPAWDDPAEVAAFARAHLVDDLVRDLGVRDAIALLEALSGA